MREYSTSGLGEFMNSGPKANISKRNYILLEIRKFVIQRGQDRQINRQYLKGRQRTPSRKELVITLMKNLNVSSEIANRAAHSIEKRERLEPSQIENENDAPFYDFCEAHDGRESCLVEVDGLGSNRPYHKVGTPDLLCSHICAVLEATDSMGKLLCLIHHWRIDNESQR
jgi:hypothetical protein